MLAQKLFRNFVVLFAGNVVGQLCFFVGLAHLARVLGPSEFGLWNFGQAWLLYLFRAGEFGLEVVGIRETARNPERTREWVSTVVGVRFVLAVILFAATLLIAWGNLIPSDSSKLVMLFALAVFPMALVLEWVFEARQEVGIVSVGRVVKGALFALMVFMFVQRADDAEKSVVMYVLSVGIPTAIVSYAALSRFGFNRSRLKLAQGIEALRSAAPIGAATILSQFSLFLGTMVAGYMLSKAELGYYTAAHRILVFLLAYVIASSHRILLPTLSRYFHESLPDYSKFVEKFFRLAVLSSVPIGIAGTLSATTLIPFLYSSVYQPAAIVFQVLIWTFIIATIRTIFEIAMIAADQQRRYLKGMLFLATAYSLTTPLLAIRFGITGIAVASVVSELSYLVYLLVIYPYSKRVGFVSHLAKSATGAVIAGAAAYMLKGYHFTVPLMIGVFMYTVVMVLAKGISKSDISLLRSILHTGPAEAST